MQDMPNMLRPLALVLILAAAMVIAVDNVSLEAQSSASSQAPGIAVNLTLQKENVPLGQSPWANLTVENLTDNEITMDEPRLHVEGEKGELPMKPEAQIVTQRLQPRIPRLRTVLYVPWTIAPKETSTDKYQLTHFFDLRTHGR
jgi:hypothetical protein